jgi:hypothetical protein
MFLKDKLEGRKGLVAELSATLESAKNAHEELKQVIATVESGIPVNEEEITRNRNVAEGRVL